VNRILFEPNEIGADGHAVFGGVRAEHVRLVLHGTVGQPLKTGVVGGKVGVSVIEAVTPTSVAVRCVHDQAPLPPWCDLVLAPPRPRVLKRLLPQLATLGVRRLFLVGAEKVEKAFWGAQLLKPEIYRPLLIEGLMQGAVSTQLPEIHQEKRFSKWLSSGDFTKIFENQPFRIIAHPPQPGTVPMPAGTVTTSSGTVRVFAIGPEGGWTDSEVALLEAHGFVRHSLGQRILKTETATIALLSRFMDFTMQDSTRKE
jgi:RsmE family RNA methyltransferase